ERAALAARAAAQPRSLTGPPNSQRRPRPVAAMTIASVEVPLAGSPSSVRTPASATTMTLASVTVITRFTSAAGVAAASTTRMVLIVDGSHAATAVGPALAGLLRPTVTIATAVLPSIASVARSAFSADAPGERPAPRAVIDPRG